MPGAFVTLPAPPVVLTVAFYAALGVAARRETLGRGAVVVLVSLLGLLAVSGVVLREPPPEPRLTVLAVGHGLATVLETPEGGILAYDAGSARPRIFEQVILPFLRSRRISRLDALIISHHDSDHENGAGAFRRRMPIGEFHLPRSLVAGDRFDLPGAGIEVLWPPPDCSLPDNDASTVLRISAGGLTVLFTGDIEEEAVTGLLSSGVDLRADVLVLPHHGRPNLGGAELVRAVRPKILVSSDAPGEPLDPAFHAAIRTGECGAITVLPGGRVRIFRSPRDADEATGGRDPR